MKTGTQGEGMTEKALVNNNTSFHYLNSQSLQCSFSHTLWGHLWWWHILSQSSTSARLSRCPKKMTYKNMSMVKVFGLLLGSWWLKYLSIIWSFLFKRLIKQIFQMNNWKLQQTTHLLTFVFLNKDEREGGVGKVNRLKTCFGILSAPKHQRSFHLTPNSQFMRPHHLVRGWTMLQRSGPIWHFWKDAFSYVLPIFKRNS